MKQDPILFIGLFLFLAFCIWMVNLTNQPTIMKVVGSMGRVNSHPNGNRVGPDQIYPNPQLTPGSTNPDVTQANIKQNICNPHWSTKSIRPSVTYTNALKLKELKSGYTYNGDTNPQDYELDHLISLELGGNPTDPGNLWPESYKTNPVNAHDKDKIENLLHKEVCDRTITLPRAQQIISHDWYACFRDSNAGQKESCL